jgi:hypothetical protein
MKNKITLLHKILNYVAHVTPPPRERKYRRITSCDFATTVVIMIQARIINEC